jgi:hypothetical protein
VEGGAAAWSPREVAFHTSTDLEGGLSFVLENATPRTQVFEASGLFEQIIMEGSENVTVKPMRVYVAPEETVRIRVSAEQLNLNIPRSLLRGASFVSQEEMHRERKSLTPSARYIGVKKPSEARSGWLHKRQPSPPSRRRGETRRRRRV